MNTIVKAAISDIELSDYFNVSDKGLQPQPDAVISLVVMELQGKRLKVEQQAWQLQVGDWANLLNEMYGNDYEKTLAMCGLDNYTGATIESYASLARNLPYEIRRSPDVLPFSFQRKVARAGVPTDKKKALLDKCIELRQQAKSEGLNYTVKNFEALVLDFLGIKKETGQTYPNPSALENELYDIDVKLQEARQEVTRQQEQVAELEKEKHNWEIYLEDLPTDERLVEIAGGLPEHAKIEIVPVFHFIKRLRRD